MTKTIIRIIKGIILVIAIFALGNLTYKHLRTYYDDYMYEYKGTESTQGEDVSVTIPEGASVKEIAQILKKAGLIDYPRAFTKRLQDSEYRGKLHGGTYTLNTGMTTLEMMAVMSPSYEEDQPVHLKVGDMKLQKDSELDVFAGPSWRYCPAGVYEWVQEGAEPRFQINAQNCVHCKTCDIKDPNGNITWVPPEGGGGPNYEAM